MCLRLIAEPGGAAAPGSIVEYTLQVGNRSQRRAEAMTATFTFPATQELIDAQVDSPGGWVSEAITGQVRLSFGNLSGGAEVRATLRLRVREEATSGAALAQIATADWDFRPGEWPFRSNRLPLEVAAADASAGPARLELVTQGDEKLAVYDGFTSTELVSLWYDSDGQSEAVGTVHADDAGRLAFPIQKGSLPDRPGRLVAFGQCSQVTALTVIP